MPWRLRLTYATGQMPEGVKSAAFGFFLLFYYNQVLGVSASLASAAIFIALCIDAISDPIVGAWSDNIKTRWGRRHPFMYCAAIPFALCYFALFAPPAGLSEQQLWIWLLVFTAATRTAMTFYSVPYMAMGAELTQEYDERTLLAALRNVMQLIGMFVVLIGGNQLFFASSEQYANGQLNAAAYPAFALACLPFLVVGVLVAALGTHSTIPQLYSHRTQSTFTLRKVGSAMAQAFRIPSFNALVGASIVFSITQGMVQALILYTATYFFALTPGQISWLFGVAVVGIISGSLLSRPVAGLIREKRNVFAAGLGWYALFTSAVIILRLLDWLPTDDQTWIANAYIASAFISALGLGVAIPMIGSMIADITDEHERLHGEREEGIYYAAASFAGKLIGGAGPVAAGVVIDMAGIPPGSDPATIASETINRFGWLQGPSVLVLTAISIVLIRYYQISRKRHAEILAEIQARAII